MKFFKTTTVALVLALMPVTAFAAIRSGSDDYLRQELNLPVESADDKVATEDREFFDLATGAVIVTDPKGDVLGRLGEPSSILAPWGDILRAEATRNEDDQTWDFVVDLAGIIPQSTALKGKLSLVIDTDDRDGNNDEDGTLGQADSEFALTYSRTDKVWNKQFRWFNPQADFWARDRTTNMTYSTNGKTFILRIPFSEISSETPKWRVVVALQDDISTQIDVAPTIGFPPVLGEADLRPEPEIREEEPVSLLYILIVAAIGGILAGTITHKRRLKRKE